jgi:DNA invertase Pin-like site-specific DNA recombinase
MKAAIYARVSTLQGQTCENQLLELRRYLEARGWTVTREYVDEGVSGAKERRPALDELVRDAKRRRFDVLVVWRLDRLGRNLRHLILLLDDLQATGVAFVSLSEGIDATTPLVASSSTSSGPSRNLSERGSQSGCGWAWRGRGETASTWVVRQSR